MSVEQFGRAVETVTPGGDVKPSVTKFVLLVLAWHADADGLRSWPSVATVSRITGYDSRTVQRALRILEAGGLISIAEPAQGKLPNVYRLHLNPRPTDTRRTATRGNESPVTPGDSAPRGGNETQRGGIPPPNPSGKVMKQDPERGRARETAPAPDLSQSGTAPRPGEHELDMSPEAKAARAAFRERLRTLAAAPLNGNGAHNAPPPVRTLAPPSDPALIELRRRQAAELAASLTAAPPSAGSVSILAALPSQSGKSDPPSGDE